MSGSTRSDISATLNLLLQFSQSPHRGHLDSTCYVLQYLAGCPSLGICFCERCALILSAFAAWPKGPGVYTDANWGPQDASQPSSDPVVAAAETVLVRECRSLCV